jgi:hypothetical protein
VEGHGVNQMPGALANRMSDAEFERAREELRERYGDNRAEAGNRYEQELAKLFWRSGWTQEELAAKEGKSRQWITQRLVFGRFLEFATMVAGAQNLPKNLSERYFRGFWSQTDKDDNERQRFTAVWDAMSANTEVRQPKRPLKQVRQRIAEKFADGKWHGVDRILNHLDDIEDEVIEAALARMTWEKTAEGIETEKKPVGRSFSYRFFPTDRTVSLARLKEEFAPVIEALIAEGKKSPVTCSPGTVARLANQLMKLLEQWGK